MSQITKNWLAVNITVDSEAAEAIEFALNECGTLGTEIDLLGIRASQAETVVTGYFNEKPDEQDLRFQISDALRIFSFDQNAVKKLEWREVEDRDWLAEWKKHWKATEIGRFVVAPPWENVDPTDKTVIRIEPNMAFGTGTHETTQLCLKTIGELYDPIQTFLDVGTGTGILAIAAAKLATEGTEKIHKNLSVSSVAKILACDTDADSVKIARENAVANGVGGMIVFADGSLGDETPVYDFVCANLTSDVIIPILPLLLGKSRQTLLLSGILAEQKEIIDSELIKFQISNVRCESAGDWISVIIRKEF